MSLESSLCWFFSDMNRVLCHLSVGLTGSISVTDPCSTASWHMAPAQLEANYMTDDSLKSLTHICMHFSSEECTKIYNFCTSQQASPISPHLSVSLLVFFPSLWLLPSDTVYIGHSAFTLSKFLPFPLKVITVSLTNLRYMRDK